MLIGAGCAAPRLPRPSAARPTLLPDGDQIFRATGGHDFVLYDGGHASDLDERFLVDFAYAVGVNDRVTWATPMQVGRRLWNDLGSELVVFGGIDGLGWEEAWLRPSHGDPRQPNRRVSSWLVRGALGATGRHFLRDRLTLETSVRARQGLYGGRLEDFETAGSFTILVDLGDRLSLALSATGHAEYDADEARLRRGWMLGGDGVSLLPIPTVALHVRDNLDLVVWTSLDYFQGDDALRLAVAGGIRWHGRRASHGAESEATP